MDRNDLNFSDLLPKQTFSLPAGCENSGHCIRQVEAAAAIEFNWR